MKKMINLLSISIMLCLVGCVEVIDVEFVNNTDMTLVCSFEYRDIKDTILHEHSPWVDGIKNTDLVIEPHSTQVSRFNKSGFSDLEEKGLCKSFYFFDIDSIKAVSWDRIRTENMVIKKVHIYSLNDILYKYDKMICVP